MLEDGKNTGAFQNHHKQMVPYVVYADFEALIRKFHGCEQQEGLKASYTKKTERHEACSFSYIVARSDGTVSRPVVYTGENAVEVFWKKLLHVETEIRGMLATPKPLVMTVGDWQKTQNRD